MKHASSKLVIGLFAGALLGMSGCVFGNNSERPELAVDLIWDKTEGERFVGADCKQADVLFIEWKLKDDKGHTVSQSEDDGEDCQPGFSFRDLEPGKYSLEVIGYDAAEQPRWASKCTGLSLERFDTVYACEIDQVPPAQQ